MPVQEMSDARQAITAAKEAGAEEHAAEQLLAAEESLHSAEKYLNSRNYAVARREALEAKAKAIDALRRSEASQEEQNEYLPVSSARRVTVKGRVQGVFFRESTRRVAEGLGITGHAINLSNGDVEVLACGDEDALVQLAEYLKSGPTMAVVTRVESEMVDYAESGGFVTG